MAHQLIQGRRPAPYWKLDEVQSPAPVRLYKAVPEKVWMNDGGQKDGYYIDIRNEASL